MKTSPVWRQVVVAKCYEVSDQGQVRSLDRTRKSDGARIRGMVLKPSTVRGGYQRVRLSVDSVGRDYSVHRLVLEAFIGACPAGMEGCHNDGNPANNALNNLRWDTPQSNCSQREQHGTLAIGQKSGRAKLTQESVESIRQERAGGVSARDLAERYGVSHRQIRLIARGISWKHVG